METEDRVLNEIVEAAQAYFLRYGYSRVSTDEIVRSIGRSKKTLYKHFETKEALLQAVLQRVNTNLESEMVTLVEGGFKTEEDLRRILLAVGLHLGSTGGVLFDDLKAKAPDLHSQHHVERQGALGDLLQRVFAQATDNGFVAADAPVQPVIRCFLASAEHLVDPLALAQNAGQPPEELATLVNMVLATIRA